MDSSKIGSVRRRLTPEQRHQVLARYQESQMTQREFCAQEGVGLSTLIKWLHEDRSTKGPPVRFQEVIMPGGAPGWAIEVVSPQGWTVRCQDQAAWPRLAQFLRALPC
jgi:transposase-like protein